MTTKPKPFTQAEAKAFCQSLGLTFRKTEWGEFRVAYKPEPGRTTEGSAYYTEDLEDAIDTAFAMAESAKFVEAFGQTVLAGFMKDERHEQGVA